MKYERNWGRLGMESDWQVKKLSDLVEFNPTERLPKGAIAKKISMDMLQPYTKDVFQYELQPYNGGAKFRNGDTIMARITPCLENGKVSKVNILTQGEVGFGSTEYIVLRAIPNVSDPDFIYYLTISDFVRAPAIKSMVGSSGRQRVQQNVLETLKLPLPPYDEQKKIAAVLSALDEKIAIYRAINENLEEQAQALVKEYCSSTDSEIALGSIMNIVNGFAFQSKSYQKNGKYRIVTIKNVQDGRIDTQGAAYIDEVPAKMKNECYLRVGDILLSLTGNVGRVGIVFENNLLLNQRVAKFTSSKDILPLLYFFFRLSETKVSLETIAKGTAQQNLSPIETLKLSFPYDEDKALILSQTLKPMFDSIVNNSVESSKLAQLRDSLLPKLMSGELDVSDIDL